MKKRAVKVLLPLLFSFCCVFSGFLSVDAFAYTSYDNFPFTVVSHFTGTGFSYYDINVSAGNVYKPKNAAISGAKFVGLGFSTDSLPVVFPVNVDLFNYYLVGSLYGEAVDISQFTYFPDNLEVFNYDHNNTPVLMDIDNINYYHIDNSANKGFSFSCQIDISEYSTIGVIRFTDTSLGTLPANLNYEVSCIAVLKSASSGDAQQAIVNAINNQTNQLSSDIGQAADDIQQSIEDQYSGEPETEFSVDDVITQHNEKMGVLSFGSDVMLQFLDMFQSANVGTAELTLPGFNITVENVEYSVWPDYSFNFEQLNEWVPVLMQALRVMLPAFVWLMVLRYCIKVFEDNFLSK